MAVGLWPVRPFYMSLGRDGGQQEPRTQFPVMSRLPEAPGPYTWRNEDGEEENDILKLSFVAGKMASQDSC